MKRNEVRFIELIRKAFSGRLSKRLQVMRTDREQLQAEREQLFNEYIKPIDEKITELSQTISAGCEHPSNLVEVAVKGWYSDDGEGNSWNGDRVILKCSSCGFSKNIESNSDNFHGPRFPEDNQMIGGANLNVIWDQVQREAHEDDVKLRAKIREENERKEYERLHKKFGG